MRNHAQLGAGKLRDERIAAALAKVGAPVFLARQEVGRDAGRLTIFTTDRAAARVLRERAGAALAARGVQSPFRVVVRRLQQFDRAASYQALARNFGTGAIAYDPTRVVGRVESVVRLGRVLRREIDRKVTGVYIEPDRRTLFVIVDAKAYPEAGAENEAARAGTLRTVGAIVARWQANEQPGFDLAIRIGHVAPESVGLVPVDTKTASALARQRLRERLGKTAIRGAIASALGLGAATHAMAAGPAVSAPNMTISPFGAVFDSKLIGTESLAGVGFTGALPLGYSFGAQLDAAVATNGYYGVGGHLFWRDPDVGLLGLVGSANSRSPTTMYRYGAEGQLYLDAVTLSARGGGQGGTVSGGWADFDITFYATPNLSFTGGVAIDPQRAGVTGKVEWRPAFTSIAGMSVFADGKYSDSNNWHALGGLSFHFGPAKTLIDRDRRDDPFSLTPIVPTKY